MRRVYCGPEGRRTLAVQAMTVEKGTYAHVPFVATNQINFGTKIRTYKTYSFFVMRKLGSKVICVICTSSLSTHLNRAHQRKCMLILGNKYRETIHSCNN
jgi:hypothetical protein